MNHENTKRREHKRGYESPLRDWVSCLRYFVPSWLSWQADFLQYRVLYPQGVIPMRAILAACGLVGLLLLATPATSQDEKAKKGDKPGPIHEQLMRLAGEYSTVSTFRLKPDQPPMESTGSAKITSIHG